jgi:hypothetical protein
MDAKLGESGRSFADFYPGGEKIAVGGGLPVRFGY